MCSICGYFSYQKVPTRIVTDMLQKTEHRGPDAHGLYADGEIWRSRELSDLESSEKARVCLGHSELSIVKGGEDVIQPFRSCDGTLSLVHNGEIYNSQELRGLLSKAHTIEDKDNGSEILLHLIEEIYDGDLLRTVQSVVKMLNGMYSFAVTDGDEVVIARDPAGIKPVYYVEEDGCVYFCSEKKGLYDVEGEIQGIPPGKILRANKEGISIHQGVRIERPQIDIMDFDEAVTLYKSVLTDTVESMLRGLSVDKVGMIFSGGVDSVLIAKLISDFGWNLRCYCVGKEGSEDVNNAEKVANDLGLDLRVIYLDERTVEAVLPEIIESIEMEGLLQVEVAVPMYLAAKAASEDGVKVVFNGQGADELFAGYWWYKDVVNEDGFLKLHDKLWEDIDLAYDDTLEREDKVTMAHSVELRVPYLDRNVVRCAMRISPRLKIKSGEDSTRKWVHRNVAARVGVPDYTAYRAKDMAQSGSGVHSLVKKVAERYFKGKDVEHVEIEDKGSNYRYLNEDYGTPEMRAYMHEIAEDTQCLER
ncbi:asparagine synthetase B [ANME-1 cluster archaeon GoMg4]|nr:asparagine synthetase B [ANME-1 cluster archaeon GoMg4]